MTATLHWLQPLAQALCLSNPAAGYGATKGRGGEGGGVSVEDPQLPSCV